MRCPQIQADPFSLARRFCVLLTFLVRLSKVHVDLASKVASSYLITPTQDDPDCWYLPPRTILDITRALFPESAAALHLDGSVEFDPYRRRIN